MYETIQLGVPNIPEEAIRLWLLPFAEHLGWPPTRDTWGFKIGQEPIEFWNDAAWSKETINLSELDYSRGYHDTMRGLHEAYIQGINNIYFQDLGEDGKSRFTRSLRYIVENQRFPQPPIIYPNELGAFEIMDGNHRFFSYVMAQRNYEAFSASSEEQKIRFLEGSRLKEFNEPLAEQEVWICRPNWANSDAARQRQYLRSRGLDL
jgi:hypothetical protein